MNPSNKLFVTLNSDSSINQIFITKQNVPYAHQLSHTEFASLMLIDKYENEGLTIDQIKELDWFVDSLNRASTTTPDNDMTAYAISDTNLIKNGNFYNVEIEDNSIIIPYWGSIGNYINYDISQNNNTSILSNTKYTYANNKYALSITGTNTESGNGTFYTYLNCTPMSEYTLSVYVCATKNTSITLSVSLHSDNSSPLSKTTIDINSSMNKGDYDMCAKLNFIAPINCSRLYLFITGKSKVSGINIDGTNNYIFIGDVAVNEKLLNNILPRLYSK